MNIDERARRASREVEEHFAGGPPPPPWGSRLQRREAPSWAAGPSRWRVMLAVLIVVLGAASLGAALLFDDNDADPVRTGPGPRTVTTPTSAPTSTGPVPSSTPLPEPPDPQPPGGVVPPRSVRGDRVSFRVTDASGETYLVEVPASTPGVEDVLAVPSLYVGPAQPAPVGDEPGIELGMALFEQPAAVIALAEASPGFTPVAGAQRTLAGGAVFTQWEQVGTLSPQRFPMELSTIERRGRTLALSGPRQDNAPRVADALIWTIDEDGFHRLSSRDPALTIGASPPEPISLQFRAPERVIFTIDVARGCEALQNFDFASGNLGPWSCLGEYRVQVEGDPGAVADVLGNIAVRAG